MRRVLNALAHIWHELKHVGHGFKKLGSDIAVAGRLEGKDYANTYKDKEYFEAQKVRQVRTDVVKFIPFSFFILIPGAEILLPPFLMVFPNAMPSQFVATDARQKKFLEIKKRRAEAAQKLLVILPRYFSSLETDANINA